MDKNAISAFDITTRMMSKMKLETIQTLELHEKISECVRLARQGQKVVLHVPDPMTQGFVGIEIVGLLRTKTDCYFELREIAGRIMLEMGGKKPEENPRVETLRQIEETVDNIAEIPRPDGD